MDNGFDEKNITLPRIKISMLGTSGVGKTSYIGSLINSFRGYTYGSEKATETIMNLAYNDQSIEKVFASIVRAGHLRNDEEGFPRATDDSKGNNPMIKYELQLTLEANSDEDDVDGMMIYYPVEINDYKGGLGLTDEKYFDSQRNREMITVWSHEIEKSDVVVIPIDSIYLSQFDKTNKPMYRERLGCDATCELFTHFYNEIFSQKSICVIILLTKSDSNLVPGEYRENGYERLKRAAEREFGSIINQCRNCGKRRNSDKKWQYGIIPVGVAGQGNCTQSFGNNNIDVNTIQNRNYRSTNIIESFLFGMYYAAYNRTSVLKKEIDELEQTLKGGTNNNKEAFYNKKSKLDRFIYRRAIEEAYIEEQEKNRREKEENAAKLAQKYKELNDFNCVLKMFDISISNDKTCIQHIESQFVEMKTAYN